MFFYDFFVRKNKYLVKVFLAINSNHMNKENLQARFSCYIFLKTHAYISDRTIHEYIVHTNLAY